MLNQIVVACSAACVLISVVSCAGPSASGPSVILITIDTVRADHLSAYGYPFSTSPNLERLASRGTTYRYAFSASNCTAPSHASIFTGQYPSYHTIGSWNGRYKLSPETETLAEILGRNGYATAAIVSNPILNHRLGLNQGFDTYEDEMAGAELNRGLEEQYADQAIDKALAALEDLEGRAFFLWLHLQDPHGPFTPPDEFMSFPGRRGPPVERVLPVGDGYRSIPKYQVFHDERRYSNYVLRYDAEIAFADHELGRLFEYLEDRGFFEDGLLAITSDHGEAFGEDEYFFAHCTSAGWDQVRVPLILAGAGIAAGAEITEPISNVALFRTVLHFVGLTEEWEQPVTVEDQSGVVGDQSRAVGHQELPEADAAVPGLLEAGDREPVYLETLNQVGIVGDDTFVRWDRHPPADEFWRVRNPNTHGHWAPLGRQMIRPLARLGPDRSGESGQLGDPGGPDDAGDPGADDAGESGDPEIIEPIGEPEDPFASSDERLARLVALLTDYQAAAEVSELALDAIRQTTRLPRRIEEVLRSLGYIR